MASSGPRMLQSTPCLPFSAIVASALNAPAITESASTGLTRRRAPQVAIG
jgi:hypothetical protein